MRLLRNLSISRKLALSSLFALALLGALVWSVLSTMAGQVARDASLRQAQHAEQAVQGAWLAARAVGIAGRELQFQQSPPSSSPGRSGRTWASSGPRRTSLRPSRMWAHMSRYLG